MTVGPQPPSNDERQDKPERVDVRQRGAARRGIAFEPPVSQQRGEKLEEWMLTYMDTVTLLVTLFVLMLSFATIAPEKFDAVASGLSLKKYGSGIMTGSTGIMDGSSGIGTRSTENVVRQLDEAEVSEDISRQALQVMRERIDAQGLTDRVEVKITDNLVDLQLRDSVLFASAEAMLLESGNRVLENIAPLLVSDDFLISVEGHTDDLPISTETFPSNWELSGARAAAVARALIEAGVAPERLQTVGHAATRPIVDNGTPEGRRENRRVNIILHITDENAQRLLESGEN